MLKQFICTTVAAATLALSANAMAEVVETDYYKLDLGDNWKQQAANEANNSFVAIYADMSNGNVVTIAITPAAMDAKATADQTVQNFTAQGGTATPVKKVNNYYVTDITLQNNANAKGQYYFSDNGEKLAVINVLNAAAKDYSEAIELVKKIEPKVDNLFPEL